MITSYSELLAEIDKLNYGTTVFNISVKNDRSIELTTDPAPYKTDLLASTDWLKSMLIRIARRLS